MVCKSDDLNSYLNLLTALICTFNQGGTGKGKSTYWLDPLLRLKNRTSPGRKKHKQVHFSSVEEHRQRHWGIRCGQAKWPVWWGRDAEWVKRSRVGNAKVTLGRVQSWHHGRLSSVQFSCSVMSDSLSPHEPQHARPPCPLPTPGVYTNSGPLSQWCHSTISSFVVPSPPAFDLSQH